MTLTKLHKLIHVAHITPQGYIFLRESEPGIYAWYETNSNNEEKNTQISGVTIGEALSRARKKWKQNYFRTLNCGFRYNLPERDEHGINALFHQMVAAYTNSNGIYFDDDVGHNCFINFASQEALQLMKQLHIEKRI